MLVFYYLQNFWQLWIWLPLAINIIKELIKRGSVWFCCTSENEIAPVVSAQGCFNYLLYSLRLHFVWLKFCLSKSGTAKLTFLQIICVFIGCIANFFCISTFLQVEKPNYEKAKSMTPSFRGNYARELAGGATGVWMAWIGSLGVSRQVWRGSFHPNLTTTTYIHALVFWPFCHNNPVIFVLFYFITQYLLHSMWWPPLV